MELRALYVHSVHSATELRLYCSRSSIEFHAVGISVLQDMFLSSKEVTETHPQVFVSLRDLFYSLGLLAREKIDHHYSVPTHF